VAAAHSADAALDLLRADQSFDVVLCDLMLGGMTGMELYELCRRRWPELASRFVFMTGGTCTAQARAFVEQQEGRTLDKPFSLSELIAALKSGGRL
jgi:CheY-like chemotaxis protein